MQTRSEDVAIVVKQVSKRFRRQQGDTFKEFFPKFFRGRGWSEPFYALRGVSFSVSKGETLGIIGMNGSGKSTLLKLIAGIMAPTEGQVMVAGRVSPLLGLGTGFHADFTGRENVFLGASALGLRQHDVKRRFDEIVEFAGVADFIDMPVKHYSSGMFMRLAFSIAVHCEPDILLIDEILAVGDVAFHEKCLAKMREFQRQGVTTVLVSHSLDEVRQFCDRTILLHKGQLDVDSATESVLARYREMTP